MDHIEQLRKQLRFIDTSRMLYDGGNFDEGVRIATAVSAIFHNTAESTSILLRLRRKDILVRSTSMKHTKDWLFWPVPNLTYVAIRPQTNLFRCDPLYERGGRGRLLSLNRWWDEIVDRRGNRKVHRRDVIQGARNTDGGAHVGDEFTISYSQLIKGSGFKMINRPDGGDEITITINNSHLATLRQIGHEILTSPDLLALGDYRPEFVSNIPDDAGTLRQGSPESTFEGRPIWVTFGQKY